MSAFQKVDESNFEAGVLKAGQPVVLEFGASWCQPCKRLEPELEKLGNLWKGRVQLAKLDVDECIQLTTQYQIMSVPTTLLFVGGQPVQRLVGFQPLNKLVEKFEPHLG
jgi:thioredoxin 1